MTNILEYLIKRENQIVGIEINTTLTMKDSVFIIVIICALEDDSRTVYTIAQKSYQFNQDQVEIPLTIDGVAIYQGCLTKSFGNIRIPRLSSIFAPELVMMNSDECRL